MDLIALLTLRDDLIIPEVKATLKNYIIYPLNTLEALLNLYSNVPITLVLIDIESFKKSQLEDILSKLENDMVIFIVSEKYDKFTMDNMPPSVYGQAEDQSIRIELPDLVEHALEKHKYKNVMNLLRQSRNNINIPISISNPNQDINFYSGQSQMYSQFENEGTQSEKFLQKKTLVNFAKMLTANFDMKKLFNYFIDSVMEITRASKMSIMLREKDGFKVKANWGLDQYIADNLKLRNDSALVMWLSKTGRIRHIPINPVDSISLNMKSEMELLQCVFSFPMIQKGKLIGIFNIDNKITEEQFYKEELEIIYGLCNYLAVAIEDIDLYHQIWYQKEFTKNILSSMNSGVIAINKDERITIFNQQASDILHLSPLDVVGRDLRNLPSPLGDILFETMTTGTSYKRYEVEIQPEGIPMGINSYRLLDENQMPIGAGIVFNDLSDSKRLEQQKRKTEKLEAVNNLMAKIAHEIRNPMTSIYTYTQLLNDRCDEKELNNFYSTAVSQSIHKLDSLIGKLLIFSDKPDYSFFKEDINAIIDETKEFILKNIPSTHNFSVKNLEKPAYINIDKKLFIKAISYLAFSAVDRTPDGGNIALSAAITTNPDYSLVISIEYSGEAFTDKERENLLEPLLNIDNLGAELNIPISYKILDEHNGTLNIKSENGKNVFLIKLPAYMVIEAEKPMALGLATK
ncbi:MAG: PAS domain-containing protein [Candidatus Firestonebacteria bacterium]|nr:PAS domain-containing protein [Candidatus Firestonebacteria bacterium]